MWAAAASSPTPIEAVSIGTRATVSFRSQPPRKAAHSVCFWIFDRYDWHSRAPTEGERSPSMRRPMLSGGRVEQLSDFIVPIACHLQRFGVSIRSQVAGHRVIRQMHSIGALVDQYRHRRIRGGVRNMLD